MTWDPCTQLSDQVLQQVGLDPGTKSVVTDAASGPASARECSWSQPQGNGGYEIVISATVHTLSELRTNTAVDINK